MSTERPRLIFRVLQLLTIPALLMFGFHLVRFALGNTMLPTMPDIGYPVKVLIALIISPATVIIGLWCQRRSRGNVVGLFLVLWGVGVIDLMRADTSPLASGFSAIYAGIRWSALFALVVYFPDGSVVPRRFQKLIDTLVILTFIVSIGVGVSSPNGLNGVSSNLLHVSALASSFRILELFQGICMALYGMVFGIPSQIIRYRRAEPAQRQQIKWLQLFFAPFGVLFVLQMIVDFLAHAQSKRFGEISSTILLVWFMAFPAIAIANAILRHKLYDIDIIIRRTLIYTVLTTILGIVYFGGIVLTQQVFRALTGQSSELAIVASTLLIAALFAPLRRRVQDVIDRRLYRKKYDAEKVLADFQKNLRDEVAMETLKANLIGVLDDTMQPTRIALWVKEPKS